MVLLLDKSACKCGGYPKKRSFKSPPCFLKAVYDIHVTDLSVPKNNLHTSIFLLDQLMAQVHLSTKSPLGDILSQLLHKAFIEIKTF